MSIPNKDYYNYKDAIDAANSTKNKEALMQIKMQLIAKYGAEDDDVRTLIKRMYY